MIQTSRQLKDWIRNLSRKNHIDPQILMRRYMMERFLERVAVSHYHDRFILKGGMLISSMIGLESRTTLDIDTTIKGFPLIVSDAVNVVSEIIQIPLEDHVTFQIRKAENIMDEMEYGGVRLHLESVFDGVITALKIDISTEDAITPREITYSYPLMFEGRSIQLTAYPLETLLAEKLETVLSRGTLNTRMRDYYDLYMLHREYQDQINAQTLHQAIWATAEKRKTLGSIQKVTEILNAIETDPSMDKAWKKYASSNTYVANAKWLDTIRAVRVLCVTAGLQNEEG